MTLGGIIPHLDGSTSPWGEGEGEEATDLQGGLVSIAYTYGTDGNHLMHFLGNYNFLVVIYFLSRVVPNKNWGCVLYECVVFTGIVVIITIHTLHLFFFLFAVGGGG